MVTDITALIQSTVFPAKLASSDVHTPEAALEKIHFRVRKMLQAGHRAKMEKERCIYEFSQLNVDIIIISAGMP